MGEIRIVVHAEGPGDLGGGSRRLRPKATLQPDDWGPVHAIVAKLVCE